MLDMLWRVQGLLDKIQCIVIEVIIHVCRLHRIDRNHHIVLWHLNPVEKVLCLCLTIFSCQEGGMYTIEGAERESTGKTLVSLLLEPQVNVNG